MGSLSGRDNLRSLAALRGLPAKRVDDVLKIVGLAGREDDKASTYSLGMKQRLGISVCASGAQLLGRVELYSGAEVAISVMTPIPTEWWLRPVSKAARVGAHSAVVWKRLYFRLFPASRSAVGVAHGPPKALEAPKPTSSSKTTSTSGAPAGGWSGSIGGNFASGSFASKATARRTAGQGLEAHLWICEELNSYHLSVPGLARPDHCRIWPLAVEQSLRHVGLPWLFGGA